MELCHGQTALPNGTCSCGGGFKGTHCEYSDAETCSGRGRVDSSGSCACDYGFDDTGGGGVRQCSKCWAGQLAASATTAAATTVASRSACATGECKQGWYKASFPYCNVTYCSANSNNKENVEQNPDAFGMHTNATTCNCNFGWHGERCECFTGSTEGPPVLSEFQYPARPPRPARQLRQPTFFCGTRSSPFPTRTASEAALYLFCAVSLLTAPCAPAAGARAHMLYTRHTRLRAM